MGGGSLSLGPGLGLTNVDVTSYRRADGTITAGGFDKIVVRELVNCKSSLIPTFLDIMYCLLMSADNLYPFNTWVWLPSQYST